MPQAHYGPIKVPEDTPDEQYLYLSDVLPTAWQAVQYANLPEREPTLAVYGLGPIGQMSARIARHLGARVIAVDRIPERIEMARRNGIEVVDPGDADRAPEVIRGMTDGRGPASVIDAVGMEAHGNAMANLAQKMTGMLPDSAAQSLMSKAGVDRLSALTASIETVRRGGTLSISGVYGGQADPLPMLTLFDKQVHISMGQANVKRWIPEIIPLLKADDPLNVADLCTHRMPLADAPQGYHVFNKKQDGAIKILLHP